MALSPMIKLINKEQKDEKNIIIFKFCINQT